MIKKNILLLLLIITFIIAQPGKAAACSCAFPDNATDAMEQASAVIQGKVLSIREETINKEKYNVALIQVEKSWKGNVDSQVKVYTSWSSCQFDFIVDEEYLLYPYEHEGKLKVINCGRSAEISLAEADLITLGAGDIPTNIVDREGNSSNSFTLWMYLVMAIIVIALYIILRTRKTKE
jgi:preprotein translocase subunit SecG